MTTEKEMRLAEQVYHLRQALNTANENAKKYGMLGVLPQNTKPSFRDAKKYYAQIRKIISEA